MARRSDARSMPTDPYLWLSEGGGGGVKQIVVGVDGSPPSLNAVATAAQIAQVANARLLVVHVKPRAAAVGLLMPGWGCMLEQWREDLEFEVGMDVAKILDPLGVTWQLSICSGDPASPIGVITGWKLAGNGFPASSLSLGFGSNRSRLLGPPSMNRKITLLALAGSR